MSEQATPYLPADLTPDEIRGALKNAVERSAIQLQRLTSNCRRTDAAHAATVADSRSTDAPPAGLTAQQQSEHYREQIRASAAACLGNHLELAAQEAAHAATVAEQERILKALSPA